MSTNKTLANLRLEGKWALVCGASKGIGAAAARALADMGADVTLVARTEESLKQTFQHLTAVGRQRHGYFTADFDDQAGLQAALDAWLKQNPRVHILVNNTGGPPGGPANAAKPEEFLAAFNRHLICNQLLVQAIWPRMREAGYGRIINVISTSVKEPIKGLGVSNTVRGAVASWSKTLAGELGQYGITVNNVLPGYTRTGRMESLFKARAEKEHRTIAEIEADARAIIPLGRIAEPDEIGAAIAFLASPAASYITGVSLPVDGGRIQSL
jgi:3-oxoacyl-[acyl-carrier protein] reductase